MKFMMTYFYSATRAIPVWADVLWRRSHARP